MGVSYSVGLIGARGHTGRVLLQLIAGHPVLKLAFASSREFAGKRVSKLAAQPDQDLEFENLSPDQCAKRGVDVMILALPDGAGVDFVETINKNAKDTILLDLSADYRFVDDWLYGLPELARAQGKDFNWNGAKRIANPGCYATAMQLGLAPLADIIEGVPSVFGVSGFSGAGTKPSPNNDPDNLRDNLIPYKLTGHNHEREASRHLGFPVRFTPHVHPAFSGIVTTLHVPFSEQMTHEKLRDVFKEAYQNEPLIRLSEKIPDLRRGSDDNGVTIGGFAVGEDGSHGVIVCAEDNLRKGAAVQAVQNINLAMGLDEFCGLDITQRSDKFL